VRIVCDATVAFIKMCNVLSAIIEMAVFREQRVCIKICFKLGKTPTDFYEILKTVFWKQNSIQTMGKSGVTSTEDGKASEKKHQVNVDLFL